VTPAIGATASAFDKAWGPMRTKIFDDGIAARGADYNHNFARRARDRNACFGAFACKLDVAHGARK
jgi:hypothetical protein